MARDKARGGGAGRGIRRPPPPAGRRAAADTGEESHLPWSRRNHLILLSGVGAILIGFLLLRAGDTVLAPILLVGGYLGLIPWGILAGARSSGRGGGSGPVPPPAEGTPRAPGVPGE